MKSRLFFSDLCRDIETKVAAFLNSQEAFLPASALGSPRAAGDAIEEMLGERLADMLGDFCGEYSADFARRAMADIAFTDVDGLYYVVDVKTHRTDTRFNMPNLTSVERLARFYEDGKNYFALLLISYHLQNARLTVTGVTFVPIEFLAWDCLTIGALGWGQIQIADSNRVIVNSGYSRKRWMVELCDTLLDFYPKEIAKIGERIERFQRVKDYWLAKPDD